jgi:hypothetical protein
MKLVLENVRSFVGRHEIPIKPLTLLVGENNAGKSTFLACLHAACQYPEFPFRVRWNDAPYHLGTFDTIASRSRLKSNEPARFAIGIEDVVLNSSELFAVFQKHDDRIVPSSIRIRYNETILNATVALNGEVPPRMAHVELTQGGQAVNLERQFPFPVFGFDPLWSLVEAVLSAVPDEPRAKFASEQLTFSWMIRQTKRPRAISLGPRRVDPARGYPVEQLSEDGQGSDYPDILIQHRDEQFKQNTRAGLLEALADFGKDSGLFSRVEVKRIGSGGSRSIQVRVVVAGKSFDLTDVGYGVSQILPVVVKTFASIDATAILIQQPEVHLHPQAQAAMGSFLARMTTLGGPSLVIETHSDYILDRLRIEVAHGRISPDQIALLYFEKPGKTTTVHAIKLDECGNILNAPPSYRKFFMREEMNLLTRTKKA